LHALTTRFYLIIKQAENVSREHLLEAIKLVLIALAWAFLPSDILSLLGYGVGAGAVNAILRYPYSKHLENEADQVGIHLAAKVGLLIFIFYWRL
jgi:Zn-dependent protease with chaperone function